ncbi:MAG: response regulator [Peptoniphilaceae bacterium]|nr:response regulator [Peptoniphilaceae bacterium]MDD7383638.1 response regulator [Peptoniphilaceae bacterium]MDY3737809.1 response regulator [Peptoniphilaceae bacterium]
MLKVLIVEDEKLIKEKLVHFPDYESLKMKVVAVANNGKEGMDYIKKLNPDIVISDIKMPLMTGLDMIENTLEYDYVAIIISGFNEFDFAKRAIKYGVSDYILKPIDIDELTNSLKNAKEILEMRKIYREENYKIDLLNVGKKQKDKNELVEKMILYIKDNYEEKISISDLSKILNYSETLLNSRFKEYTSITFNEYLNRYRIKKALEYINSNKFTIEDISYLCGFSSPKYFSKVFKKYMGISPKKYEQQL